MTLAAAMRGVGAIRQPPGLADACSREASLSAHRRSRLLSHKSLLRLVPPPEPRPWRSPRRWYAGDSRHTAGRHASARRYRR